MSKIKQTNITKDIPKKDTPAKATTDLAKKLVEKEVKEKPPVIKLTSRELRLIEEFRSLSEEANQVEQMAALKELREEQEKARKREEQRVWDNVIVEGMFTNHESRGGTAEFTFYKHKGDPVRKYKLKDGHKHRVPRMVAIHLNENCKYRIHDNATDEDGKRLSNVGEVVKRYSFYSTQFVDVADPRAVNLFPSKEVTTVSYG